MKKIIIAFLAVLSMSCEAQQKNGMNRKAQVKYIGEGVLDLEKLDFTTFNAPKFYSRALTGQSSIVVSKVRINTKGYVEETGELLGYRYSVIRSNSDTKVVDFDGFTLSMMEAIVTENDKLMALFAYGEVSDSASVKEVISNFNTKFGPAIEVEDDWFGPFTSRTWQDGSRIIQLVSQVVDIPQTRIDKDGNRTFLPEPTLTIKLFITIAQYQGKIQGKLHQGEWLLFR